MEVIHNQLNENGYMDECSNNEYMQVFARFK